MNIGDKVKYYRKLANTSQLEVELSTNLSTGTLSRRENSVINATKETLFAIAKPLKLNKAQVA